MRTQIKALVVGIVGILGCVGAWLLYRSTVRKDTARLTPNIEAAYDKLAAVCEEGQTVLSVG